MIKITGIEMDDFGRHKRISQKLDGNVIGLAGPNGKGKSTVIQALQLALTGTIEHPDSLNSFIRLSSCDKPPKKARVKVDFEADGKKGSITRIITNNTNSRELVWEGLPDDVRSLTADKRVADVLFEILGVDKKAINSTVFIGQGELGKMFGKDTERREFYTRLLMLGHLDKIADVVDVYRKQIADSTLDLTAVKDAADTSYTQAQEFYELCRQELGALVSPSDDIATAMLLVGLFSRHASAEQAFADAETTYKATHGPGEVSDADSELRITALQEWRDKSNLARRTHAALTSASAVAHGNVKRTADAARAYAELDKAEAALAALPPQAAVDPRTQVATLQGYLQNFKEMEKQEAQLAEITPELERCRKDLEALDDKDETEAQAAWDEIDTRRKVLVSDLRLRENLQREMVSAAATTCCTLCGSDSPDSNFLNKSIVTLKTELERTTIEVGALAEQLKQVIQRRARCENELNCQKSEHERIMLGVMRLRVLTSIVGTRANVESQLLTAEALVEAYIANELERKRLTAEAFSRSVDANVWLRPAADALVREAKTVEEADTALAACEVDPELDQKEFAVVSEMEELKRRLAARVRHQAAYAAATNQRDAVEEAMSHALEEVATNHTTLHRRLSAEGTLTAESVTKAAEDMRLEQTAYDHQIGKGVAAREAMLQASAAVGELELKIAEQGERRNLTLDLVKLRDTFKPVGASLAYLNYKFGQIATMAADYLAESQADFMVAASADVPLAFEFVRLDRADEVWMPQTRMSGGQKVRLAVATLRAIHALVMPNVGLLVLDEPTTHLDDDAVRSMAEMLKKIGDEGTLQMVVCDHNPVLIDAFSDIITIPE